MGPLEKLSTNFKIVRLKKKQKNIRTLKRKKKKLQKQQRFDLI